MIRYTHQILLVPQDGPEKLCGLLNQQAAEGWELLACNGLSRPRKIVQRSGPDGASGQLEHIWQLIFRRAVPDPLPDDRPAVGSER